MTWTASLDAWLVCRRLYQRLDEAVVVQSTLDTGVLQRSDMARRHAEVEQHDRMNRGTDREHGAKASGKADSD